MAFISILPDSQCQTIQCWILESGSLNLSFSAVCVEFRANLLLFYVIIQQQILQYVVQWPRLSSAPVSVKPLPL